MRTAITAVLVVVLAAITGAGVALLPYYEASRHDQRLPVLVGVAWLLFAAALVLLRRVPRRAAIVLVVAGSVLIGGAAMAGPPNTSTDSARYAWDGIVQNAGISPYRYAPTSPRLADLRPDWLFPAARTDAAGDPVCRGARIQTSHEPGGGPVVCTALNRGTVHTIYPPAAEILFAGVRAVVGPEAQYWPLQLVGLLVVVGVTVVFVRALSHRGRDPRWAALWAWCPLVASEAITNSHVDSIGAALLLGATLLAASGRTGRSGVLLGLAMSAKLIPVIGTPALAGRRGIRLVLVAAGVFLLLYVPYVLASGIRVLGYLPGYLSEEGYDDGTRFALLTPFVSGRAAFAVATVLLALTAALVWRKTRPEDPWVGQVVMVGVTLAVVSPRYPWYALLLVPMAAMSGRAEWLLVALALSARQLEPRGWVLGTGLAVALAVIAVVSVRRAGGGAGVRRALGELRHPWRRPGARPASSPSLDT